MLNQNMQYRGVVMGIDHAADSFPKKNSPTMMYCHFLKINVESQLEIIDAQICVAEERECKLEIDSEIKFTVTRFAKNRYTIHVLETTKSANARKKAIAEHTMPVREDLPPAIGSKPITMPEGYIDNPLSKGPAHIGAGVEDQCLYASAIFHMMRNSSVDDMIATAREIKTKYYAKTS